MLIIFDLDDTLIDTSGTVTPFKLRLCLQRLVDLGMAIENLEKAEEELLQLNAQSLRSKDAVFGLASKYFFDLEKAALAVEELTSPLPENFSVASTPYAKEVLQFFRPQVPLALVTGGAPLFQRQKMEKAGIEPGFFCKIEIPEDSVKKPVYEGLLREFSLPPQDVWVCGDRVAMDLAPAKELGMKTIHMQWGRGGRQKGEAWVDHRVCDLRELKGIVR